MRIGLLASIGPTLDMFFPQLVEHWGNAGWEVVTAAGTPSRSFDTAVLKGITRRPSLANWAASGQIRAWAEAQQLDAIITNTATASALARIRNVGVPVVYFCHGLHWNAGKRVGDRVWQAIESLLLRHTRAVITMNSDDRSWFSARVPSNRLLFLKGGVGVPLDEYPEYGFPIIPPLKLLWAGEFTPRKRPKVMLDIASALQERTVDFRLVMLGDGVLYDEVKRLAADRGLLKVIDMPGRQPLQHWLINSHMMVHTAEWEGLPRVLLEGYAMGRRALAFDVKGVRDVPQVTLVSNGDTRAFAEAVVRARTVPELIGHNENVAWLDSANVAREIHRFTENVIRGD